MESVVTRTVINSLIWMICGALVITIRVLILQSASLLAWELLGAGMIGYGAVKILLMLARGIARRNLEHPTSSSSSSGSSQAAEP